MNNRVAHVDIAKGISILLVALFHSQLKFFIPGIVDSMSLFRVPLFFFLSGVFFSPLVRAHEFTYKRAEGLLKPYFSVLILILIIDVLFVHKFNFIDQLLGIIYGTGYTIRWVPMWFLPHLFVVHCFSYFLFRHTRFERTAFITQCFMIILLLALGILIMDFFWLREVSLFNNQAKLQGLPFSLDIIFITSSFFIAGYTLRSRILQFNPNKYCLMLAIFIFLCITLFTQTHTDLNYRTYTNPVFATLGAIAGIYIILFLSQLIEKIAIAKIVLTAFGSASLFILIFHSFIGNKLYGYLTTLLNHNHSIYIAIFTFISSITLPLCIKWLVERNRFLALFFLPFRNNTLFNRRHAAP